MHPRMCSKLAGLVWASLTSVQYTGSNDASSFDTWNPPTESTVLWAALSEHVLLVFKRGHAEWRDEQPSVKLHLSVYCYSVCLRMAMLSANAIVGYVAHRQPCHTPLCSVSLGNQGCIG